MKPSLSTTDLSKLVDTVCTAAKNAEGGDVAEQGRALEGLRALKKQQVNTKLLSDTQAGKRIRFLSKHPDAGIAKAAAEVVGAWKEVVRREADTPSSSQAAGTAGARSEGGHSEAGGPASSQQQQQQSGGGRSDGGAASIPTEGGRASSSAATSRLPPLLPSTAAAAPPAAGPPFDPSQLPKCGDELRDKCRLNIAKALQLAMEEGVAGAAVAVTAVAVENEIFKVCGGAGAAYKAKFRNLHFNLADKKNPDLRRKVLTGVVAPDTLVTLPPEELASDAKKAENDAIREKKLFHAAPSQAKQATTDQFQCGKCKQRKCTYYQMQTRSADEPMTTFVSCLACGNRWKFC